MAHTPEYVIDFWFNAIDSTLWFKKDNEFDLMLTAQFSQLQQSASCAELFQWRTNSEGRLAEIIVLDQFSRNIHRDTPLAFASDPLALALAQEAVANGCLEQLDPVKQSFLLMPYMHSESVAIHEVAVELFTSTGLDKTIDYELRHQAIINRFGRYPHRNNILGRESTQEELEFLKTPGSSF
jgi:uncharacterized protein (DUF924 family)